MPQPITLALLASIISCLFVRGCGSASAHGPCRSQTSAVEQQISAYVREVYQDRDGHYWFGTNGEGVGRYDGTSLAFFAGEQGLAGAAIRGIVQDDEGAMWFATDAGVSRLAHGAFTNYTVRDGLSDNSTWSILRDRSGAIWVGTHEGVCRFDGARFVPVPLPRVAVDVPESRFTPKVVFAMHQDDAGCIWFGTDGEGVHRYDGRAFTSFTTKEGLGGNMVRCIGGDRLGRVWIGSDGGGVTCFDGSAFRTLTTRDGLSNNRVFEILEDRTETLWFSTLGAGVCRYDGIGVRPYAAAQGLGFDEVLCACGSGKKTKDCHATAGIHVQDLFEDRDGRLWAGCSGGLFRLEGDSFVNVTRSGPWPPLAPRSAGALPSAPLASFARMLGGEWRVTFANGTEQFDRWSAGPGGHSIASQTFGTDASGSPWRSLGVFYWHPGRREVLAFGLHPEVPGVGRGQSRGTVLGDDEERSVILDLQQSGNPLRTRKLKTRTVFDGPDKHRVELLEDNGRGFAPLVEWEYLRSREPSEEPHVAAEAGRPTDRLKAFEPLLAHAWEAEGASANGGADGRPFHVRTTFEWIPYIEVIVTRSALIAASGEKTPLLDAYIFRDLGRDLGTGTLQALALSSDGTVYEGGVTIVDGPAIEFDLMGHGTEQPARRRVRLDLEADGTLRSRIWSDGESDRALLFDLRQRRR